MISAVLALKLHFMLKIIRFGGSPGLYNHWWKPSIHELSPLLQYVFSAYCDDPHTCPLALCDGCVYCGILRGDTLELRTLCKTVPVFLSFLELMKSPNVCWNFTVLLRCANTRCTISPISRYHWYARREFDLKSAAAWSPGFRHRSITWTSTLPLQQFPVLGLILPTHQGACVLGTKTTFRLTFHLFYMLKHTQYREQIFNPNDNGQACIRCCDDPKGCSDTTDRSLQGGAF